MARDSVESASSQQQSASVINLEVSRRSFLSAVAGSAAVGLSAAVIGPHSLLQAAQTPAAPDKRNDQWPSFRNGNTLTGIAGSGLPDKLELLWKVPVQDGVTATAAIVDGHAYAGTYGGELISFNLRTGERQWTYFSAEKKKPNDFIPGFQSSPTVTGDLIVIGDEDGFIHAVDRRTGELRWKHETLAEIISSAAVVGDRIIVGSYDAVLYCFDPAGKLLWKFETQDRINGSPAIAGDLTFVTGCDQHLRAINITTGEEAFDMPLERFLIASPAVVDSMLYVGTHEGEFLAIDVDKQEVVWRYQHQKSEQPIHSSAAVTDEFIVYGAQNKLLHCLERATGQLKWTFAARGQINSSPVIVGGNRVFAGSNDGTLYEVGLQDGSQKWKEKLGRSVTASPAVGENCLVIGAEGPEGEIHCFGKR